MEIGSHTTAGAAARIRIESLYGRSGQTGRGGWRIVHFAVIGVTALVRAGAILLDDLRVALLQGLWVV